MSETSDWKQKYRDALMEAEADEKQWREVERVLRRLIGRLCAAAMGVDRQLDEELTALAAANRRNAAAVELEGLAKSLTSAVVAVDATSPVPQLVLPPRPPRLPRKSNAGPRPARPSSRCWNASRPGNPTLRCCRI